MIIEPKKILLVHNNPEERGHLGIMLSRFGHEVRFSCGKGCPDQLSRDNDLVIVDDKLAGQSGFDFFKQISKEQCEKIIYLSSRLWLGVAPQPQTWFSTGSILKCLRGEGLYYENSYQN
jgi:CheY-like chemotaxis protein